MLGARAAAEVCVTAHPDELRACAAYQCKLLDAAASLLKIGGVTLTLTRARTLILTPPPSSRLAVCDAMPALTPTLDFHHSLAPQDERWP